MITSGFTPTIFVTNCLIQMYVTSSCLDYAHKVFDHLTHKDVVSWNGMITGYANVGRMCVAVSLFDAMPERDVVSFNSIMSGFLRNGKAHESVAIFVQMGRNSQGSTVSCRDFTSFAIALKACSAIQDCLLGAQMHGLCFELGFNHDVVTGSALVDMYGKCKFLDDALRLFHELRYRNSVSWSAIIAGCVQNEEFKHGLKLFVDMQRLGIDATQSAYASILRTCGQFPLPILGRQIHAHVAKRNFSSDTIVGTAMLDMYLKNGNVEDAGMVFRSLPIRSVQSWNAMVVGLVRNKRCSESMKLVQKMNNAGVSLDAVSLSAGFSACAGREMYLEGLQIHAIATKKALDSDISVANAGLDMYGKCGSLIGARRIFDSMTRRDVVSFNAVITALEQNEEYEETLNVFDQMISCDGMFPDVFTFGTVLKACAALSTPDRGLRVHDRIIKSGLGQNSFIGIALVDMYSKCGLRESARKIHDRNISHYQTSTSSSLSTTIPVLSWNALISGYSSLNHSEESQSLFSQMLASGILPDNFTYASIIDTCADLSTISLGKQLHGQILKQKLEGDSFISSSLIDMYSKCGGDSRSNMDDARTVFRTMRQRDLITFNALISGYAHHGQADSAIELLEAMRSDHGTPPPNHTSFLSVLRACAHIGRIETGLHYFESMLKDNGLRPRLEHYSCVVDLVGRIRGELGVQHALRIITTMPNDIKPDAVIWRSLLSACVCNKNSKVAELACRRVIELQPDDSAAYVMLSNIYAEKGEWDEVSRVRRVLKEKKVRKEPGCSWVEVRNQVHVFVVGDKAHPRWIDLYESLKLLVWEMKKQVYIDDSLDG